MPVDAIIDFSNGSGFEYYAEAAAKRGVIIVSAVSQYEPAALAKLKSFQDRTVVMHSPNITLGINFLLIAAEIARELDLGEDAIKTVRAGGIIGTHEILFGFPYQTVRLKHESISREAFGNRIVFAVEQLAGKPKGFYSMEDLLLPFFKLQEDEQEITSQNRKPWWKFWHKA